MLTNNTILIIFIFIYLFKLQGPIETCLILKSALVTNILKKQYNTTWNTF